ncbi:G protein-coupled receptor 125 [Mytilus galloprovincialis]|uniref:G protein-coupled receptor 125 n=1 Tax=Mytilus galloprovincialis TaxID=29158 RepID=A0A8B6F9D0_MYTGA|nr:G protein-coupled receptor 125 [Mytilus galloprovincialis]
MANTHRAPKQWCFTKIETVNSFENWRQNIIYTLSLDPHFAPFLGDNVQWQKKTRFGPNRGFLNDGEDVAEANRRTREQKVSMLELMLGQIANYCPVISRNTIVKNSTSIENIWQTIRLHYGFQSTGAHFIDFAAIHFEPNERPEDLYQRIMAFVEDNLLRRDTQITHHGAQSWKMKK